MNLDYLKTYKEVIVIGHKNPDPDTIISSYILSKVLKYLGINAYYAILEGEKLNESKDIILDVMDFDPLIIKLDDLNNHYYFLVDHNDPVQSIMNKDLIVGVIDHHPNSNNYDKAYFTKYCSTTLAIYDLFKNIYPFSEKDKFALFMGLVDDSSFGRNSRYTEIDKKLVLEMGYNLNFDFYLKKYFKTTDLSNLIEAFNTSGFKDYNFEDIKFCSTYIKALDTNKMEEYSSFIKNNKNNILGMWIDFNKSKTYTFLKYDELYLEKKYDYIAARSTTVLNDTLKYLKETL